MSRLSTMSPAAVRALFSQESDDTLITLLTVSDATTDQVIVRLADNYLGRLSETSEEVVYGVTSRGNEYIFLPMNVTLPSEEENTAPRASLTFYDVTRHLIPIIRQMTQAPKLKMELVLTSTPDVVEASFDGFYMTNITYNAESVSCELSMVDYSVEPFPCYTFTPAFFPGLF